MNSKYYADRLSAERLVRVYDVAPKRVQQYLLAEIDYVLNKINPGMKVLELGCGYGRALEYFAEKPIALFGVDNSFSSLKFARGKLSRRRNIHLACMNAIATSFQDKAFDLVVCIQNGISAFRVDRGELIAETYRILKPGGKALFSTYSEKFWDDRLEWFQIQSNEGLLGEIDYDRTGDGKIVCTDGFEATTVSENQFRDLVSPLDADCLIEEVDQSSLFCEIIRRRAN
jgi:2-polyprenyl-6-hydroxyphenyl methylase/3-demethylubiquinone-9 3-methyltransferase